MQLAWITQQKPVTFLGTWSDGVKMGLRDVYLLVSKEKKMQSKGKKGSNVNAFSIKNAHGYGIT